MKKLLLATLFATFAASANIPYGGEQRHIKSKEGAQAAAKLVRAYGYRCDSITAFQPMVFSSGFTLKCNNFRYSYDIKDVGGRWTVTVN